MINTTLDLEKELFDLYEEKDENIFKQTLTHFNKRKTSCYACSGIDDAISNYDFLSKNQFWPMFWKREQYVHALRNVFPEKISYTRLKPSSMNLIDEPVKLIELKGISYVDRKLINHTHVHIFEDENKKHFTTYDFSLKMYENIFEKNLSKDFYLLCQATPLNAIQRSHMKKPNDYLFRLIEVVMEEGDGGEPESERVTTPPKIVYA